ncbi:hypothetical protein SEA_CEN1621_72 [Microbacterium phage Cen1621]|uniref:Uncharacterized protein n=1 Tax=Microbacterium phage Cen1621 TaxID=2965191 RepID=A0A9E7QDI2_9CAUD|nr:hypothetical protein SEA_CEN1621_72 [Microbacterium phage Cen1621]
MTTHETPEPGAYASAVLDKVLAAWHDTSQPTKTIRNLTERFPLQADANERIERAAVGTLANLAALVDAFRAHPELGYKDALDYVGAIFKSLPKPPHAAIIPASLALTPTEERALASGEGDKPVGSASE